MVDVHRELDHTSTTQVSVSGTPVAMTRFGTAEFMDSQEEGHAHSMTPIFVRWQLERKASSMQRTKSQKAHRTST